MAPTHLPQGTELSQATSCSGGCWVASGPEPPARRSALGTSSTWILKDEYSFSSGPWLGSESKELLGLMARSKEPTDNGSLSTWDISTPGLLISSSDGKFLKLVCGLGRLLPVGIVATGASKVSWKHKKSVGRSSGDREISQVVWPGNELVVSHNSQDHPLLGIQHISDTGTAGKVTVMLQYLFKGSPLPLTEML